MLGLLVHGSNHFIVEGPLPSPSCARALVRHWEIPQLDAAHPGERFAHWRIIRKAFREDLEWAVELESDSPVQDNVRVLLNEVEARGIPLRRTPGPLCPGSAPSSWQGADC